MKDSDSKKLRPIDAFIKYFEDVKPYHTKLLEVIERYNFSESMTVDMLDFPFIKATYKNKALCRAVGWGLIFDECGFSNDSCCDLFQCLGGYGLIFDNSDLIATHTVTDYDMDTDVIEIDGKFISDQRFQISAVGSNALTLPGDQTTFLAGHNIFLIAPFNVYRMASVESEFVFTVFGDVVDEVLGKKEFKIDGTRGLDGMYFAVEATYDPTDNITYITIGGTTPIDQYESIIGGQIQLECQAHNQGFYPVASVAYANGFTTVTLKAGNTFPIPGTDQLGSLQIRTALTAPRRFWLDISGEVEAPFEYSIANTYYNPETDKTYIVTAEQLRTAPIAAEIKVYGYITDPGFDADALCDTPKPANIHAVMGERLDIVIRNILAPTPTPTPTVTPTPSPVGEFFGMVQNTTGDDDYNFMLGVVSPLSTPAYSPVALDTDSILLGDEEFSEDPADLDYNTPVSGMVKMGNRLFVNYSEFSTTNAYLNVYHLDGSGQVTKSANMADYASNSINNVTVYPLGTDKLVLIGNFTRDMFIDYLGTPEKGMAVVQFDEQTDKFTVLAFALETDLTFGLTVTHGNNIFGSGRWYRYEDNELKVLSNSTLLNNVYKMSTDGNHLITDAGVVRILGDGDLDLIATLPAGGTLPASPNGDDATYYTEDLWVFYNSPYYGIIQGRSFDTNTKTWSDVHTSLLSLRVTGNLVYSAATKILYAPYKSFYGPTFDKHAVLQWNPEVPSFTQLNVEFRPQGTLNTLRSFGLVSGPLLPITPTPTPSPTASSRAYPFEGTSVYVGGGGTTVPPVVTEYDTASGTTVDTIDLGLSSDWAVQVIDIDQAGLFMYVLAADNTSVENKHLFKISIPSNVIVDDYTFENYAGTPYMRLSPDGKVLYMTEYAGHDRILRFDTAALGPPALIVETTGAGFTSLCYSERLHILYSVGTGLIDDIRKVYPAENGWSTVGGTYNGNNRATLIQGLDLLVVPKGTSLDIIDPNTESFTLVNSVASTHISGTFSFGTYEAQPIVNRAGTKLYVWGLDAGVWKLYSFNVADIISDSTPPYTVSSFSTGIGSVGIARTDISQDDSKLFVMYDNGDLRTINATTLALSGTTFGDAIDSGPICARPSIGGLRKPPTSLAPTPTPTSSPTNLFSTYQTQVIHDNPKHYWTFDDDYLPQTSQYIYYHYDLINRLALGSDRFITQGTGPTNGYAVGGSSSLILDDGDIFFPDKVPTINVDTGMSQEIWLFPYADPNWALFRDDDALILFGGAQTAQNASDFNVVLTMPKEAGDTMNLQFYFSNADYGTHYTIFDAPFIYEDWNHMVVTLDTAGIYRVFLNDVLLYTATQAITRYNFINNAQFFPKENGNREYFRCYIDEYAMYDYPLTHQQISRHYALGNDEKVINYRRPEESASFSNTLSPDGGSMYDNAFAASRDGKYIFHTDEPGSFATSLMIRERNPTTNTWSLVQTLDTSASIILYDTMECSADGTHLVAKAAVDVSGDDYLFYFKKTGATWAIEQNLGVIVHDGNRIAMSDDGSTFCIFDHSPNTTTPTTTHQVHFYTLSGGTYSLTQTLPVTLDNPWTGSGYMGSEIEDAHMNHAGDEVILTTRAYTQEKNNYMYVLRKTAGTWALVQKLDYPELNKYGSSSPHYGDGHGVFTYNNVKTVAFSDDGSHFVCIAATAHLTIRDGLHNLDDSDILVIFKKTSGVWAGHQIILDPGFHAVDAFPANDDGMGGYGTGMFYCGLDWNGNRISAVPSVPGYRAIADGCALIFDLVDGMWQVVDVVSSTRTYSYQFDFAYVHRLVNDGKTLIAVSFAEGYPTAEISIHDPNHEWYYDSFRGAARSVELPETYTGYTYNQLIDSYAVGPTYLGEKLLKPVNHFTFHSGQPIADRISGVDGTLTGSASINDSGFLQGSLVVPANAGSGFTLDEPIELSPVYSIKFWIKPGPKTGDYRTILGGDSSFSIQLAPDENKIVFIEPTSVERERSATNYSTGETAVEISEGVWSSVLIKNHISNITVQRDQNNERKNQLAAVYVNGRYVGDFTVDARDKAFTHIGTNSDGQVFSGEIAELAIFNYNISRVNTRRDYMKYMAELGVSPTPMPTPTKTPTVTPTISVSPTPTRTPTPTPSTGASPTPTPTISPSTTITPTPTSSVTPTPTVTPTISASTVLNGTYFQTVMLKQPTAYWTFAEYGYDFFDFVGANNLHGLGTIRRATGQISNHSIEIAKKYPTITTPNQLNTTNAIPLSGVFSIEAWVFGYTSTAARRPIFVSTGLSETLANNGLNLVNNTVRMLGIDAASGTSAAVITNNQWNHIVVTCGGVGTNQLKYYVNGVLMASHTATANTVNINTIGWDGTNAFDGLFDEVAVYPDVLTAGEILENYNAGAASVMAPTATSTPTPTPTATMTPTPTRTVTPTPTITHTVTATPSPTPSVGTSPTPSPADDSSYYSAAVLANSPVHYWRLNGNYQDSVGSNHGTFVNTGGNDAGLVTGGFGQSLYATAASYVSGNARVTLGSTVTFNTGKTLEFWIQPVKRQGNNASNLNARFIFTASNGATSSGPVALNPYNADEDGPDAAANHLAVSISGMSGTKPSIDMYAWSHIVITIEAGATKTYVNGDLAKTSTGGISSTFNCFGGSDFGDLSGFIDEIAFYNTVLTASDVTNHYNAGYGIDAPPATATPTPTATVTPTPTVTKTPTPTPTVTATITPTPSVTPSVGSSPTPTPTSSPSDPGALYAASVIASSPRNYWRFSSLVGGTTVVDEVGGNDLTLFDESPEGDNVGIVSDGAGNAMFINTDYEYETNRGFALATAIDTTTLTSGYSHTAWIKLEEPDEINGWDYYVAIMGDEDGQGFEMWVDAVDDIFEFYFYGASSTISPTYVDLPALWGQWVHVGHVVNSDGTWTMYMNGVEVLNGDDAEPLNWTHVFTDGSLEMMQGRGDEVVLYDRALSGTEIEDQYNAGLPVFNP